MIFLVLFAPILGLQWFHGRLLQRLLPERLRPWIIPTLLLVHLPMALYMALRPLGAAGGGLSAWLGPLARAGLGFQLYTALELLAWGLASAWWRLRRGGTAGPEDPSRRAFLRRGTALGAGFLAMGTLAGAREAFGEAEITRLDLKFPDLPHGLDGLRLVQLTDLHAGPLVGPSQLARWRFLAERERPELLLVTGDFVDSLPEELAAYLKAFRGFPAPLGRFAILGNHDYFTDPRPLWRDLGREGYACLENRSALVERGGAKLALVGLQDPMAKNGRFKGLRFGPGPQPEVAVQGLPADAWRLCLCHRPSNWNVARRTGAALTLSGHTHGGQINVVPGVSSAALLGPYTRGLFRRGSQLLYVSAGLGVVGLPIRLGAPPEMVVLTLHRG